MKAKISRKIKVEIVNKAQSGIKVEELAVEYSVAASTIYQWLRASLQGQTCHCNQARQINRLQKKVDVLHAIIGRYRAEEDSRLKKN